MNNGMAESAMRCATLDDIEVSYFSRFCEYAYRGDYTVPPCEDNQEKGNDDSWEFSTAGKRKKESKKAVPDVPPEPQCEPQVSSRTMFRALFYSKNHLVDCSPIATILQSFEPKANVFPWQNFTPVFLAHARLYCFAHMRLIAPLKALTLNKLHKTLSNFKLYADRVGDIVKLARYAYLNQDLPSRSKDGTLDDLKKLVVEYVVCEIDVIGKHDVFVEYMEEGGEFVGDFWKVARDFVK
ncbi:hypothetical protein BU23DRAFT_581912 [Bimuria novae-zelandiae CBS 107.79]|uniref:BTB domain-containing protein n=1 Tax=Bimuria novae-zelandiae CBS 107.79 TaxID=1447943 RepID=A0A6A5V3F9_9PLEO|nr:hypothetical protein BU23DRAFT_581912 [Bimuria novae-zelandiae CBS 107.79]